MVAKNISIHSPASKLIIQVQGHRDWVPEPFPHSVGCQTARGPGGEAVPPTALLYHP